MTKKLYTLEEAQIIWTKIINNRANELEKDLKNNNKRKSFTFNTQELTYV